MSPTEKRRKEAEGIVYESKWGRGVARILINRPDRRNALRTVDCEALLARIREAERTSSIGCLVIMGAGDSFCAGADLHEMGSDDVEVRDRLIHAWTSMLYGILASELAVVAGIAGPCVGGGHHLHLVADISIAREDARFKHSGLDMGSAPLEIGTYLLPLAVGLKRAKALIMRPRLFSARDALNWGLCAEVVAADAFEATVREWAEAISGAEPISRRLAKAQLNQAAHVATANGRVAVLAGLLQSGTDTSHGLIARHHDSLHKTRRRRQ
jgi:naphthoate synthase